MRTVVVVQARMGSSRLPGKALRVLAGRPLIEHVLERASAFPTVDAVVLATTWEARDDMLVEVVRDLGYDVVRGSERDVLSRVREAAAFGRAGTVVRVTGDCPFLCPEVARLVLEAQARDGWYAWNDTGHSGYPDGTDVEVFPFGALDVAERSARLPREREHVTPWIRDHYPVTTVCASTFDYSMHKLSVDTLTDYQRACWLAGRLPRGDFSLAATMAALRGWEEPC